MAKEISPGWRAGGLLWGTAFRAGCLRRFWRTGKTGFQVFLYGFVSLHSDFIDLLIPAASRTAVLSTSEIRRQRFLFPVGRR